MNDPGVIAFTPVRYFVLRKKNEIRTNSYKSLSDGGTQRTLFKEQLCKNIINYSFIFYRFLFWLLPRKQIKTKTIEIIFFLM